MIGNRYQVVKTLHGGMAIVHYCLDLAQDSFPVALKTFRPEYLPDREMRDRFLREAEIWVDLGFHPNIVQAYRTERVEPGNDIYLVLELIPTPAGKADPSLRSWILPGKPLLEEETLKFALGVVRGMKFASRKIPGFVHRDLKPENILIAPDGSAKVTDFGLAKVVHDRIIIPHPSPSLDRTQITQGLAGTPLYMSPEQWMSGDVKSSSDVYAYGCICFEMLTGQLAVAGSSNEELAHAHISGSAMNRLALSGLARIVTEFLGRCFHPQPLMRYQDWGQVEDDLCTVINVKCPGFTYPDDAPIDVSQYGRLQKAASYLAIGSSYVDLGKFEVGKQFYAKAFEIAKSEGDQHIIAFSLANLGVINANEGKFWEAIEYYQQAINLQLDLGLDHQIAMNIGNLGNAYFGIRDFTKTLQYLEKAYELAQQAGDRPNQARWMGNLGNVFLAKGEFHKALELFLAGRDLSHTVGDRMSECRNLTGAGQAYEYLGNVNKAIEHYRVAAAIAEQIGDRQAQGVNLQNIGGLFLKSNQVQQAIACIQQALDIAREINDHLLEAKALGNLGTALILAGKLDQAILVLNESFKISDTIGARDVAARADWSLGLIYEMKREYNDAIKYLRSAVIEFKRLEMPEYAQASEHLMALRRNLGLI